MKSLWSDAEAAQFSGPLGPRVYTSRLLGRDKSLVLHGGGNTSVKLVDRNLFGEEEEILYVKRSGWIFAGQTGLRSPARRPSRAPGSADGQRARHAHDPCRCACTIDRDDPA